MANKRASQVFFQLLALWIVSILFSALVHALIWSFSPFPSLTEAAFAILLWGFIFYTLAKDEA